MTSNSVPVPKPKPNLKPGFTLVELMVAMVLIAILSGMVTIAVRSTQQSARRAATESLIARIDSVIRSKWDEYRYRPLSVQLETVPEDANFAWNRGSAQYAPEEAARLRLTMLRDLMRMELPDRISDLITASDPVVVQPPSRIIGVANRVTRNSLGELILEPERRDVAWLPASQFENYIQRIRAARARWRNDNPTDPWVWTELHQSSECLYLILSSTTINGISALDVIAPVQIQDTDGDYMPEIVDAWDNPISWIRWPAGSEHPVIRDAGEDEFDILGTDWGMVRSEVETPYSLVPQVISTGPDGVLGVATTEFPLVAYPRMVWDTGFAWETSPISGAIEFIDPYARHYTNGTNNQPPQNPPTPNKSLRPGAYLPNGREFAADNISSYDL